MMVARNDEGLTVRSVCGVLLVIVGEVGEEVGL